MNRLACVVLVALAGCAAEPDRAALVVPHGRVMITRICDEDGELVGVRIGTTGPGVWTVPAEFLVCDQPERPTSIPPQT